MENKEIKTQDELLKFVKEMKDGTNSWSKTVSPAIMISKSGRDIIFVDGKHPHYFTPIWDPKIPKHIIDKLPLVFS